ncbi:MAG TPA: proton-conducting transporter membrane subunit, partial [Acidimicrobiia bacterium]
MLLAATAHIPTPAFDWHAFAPDLVLVATMVVVLIADLLLPDRETWRTSSITAVGLLGALIPIATLAHSGHDRSLFDGAYVVDHYALALKAFFIIATYITVLLSVDYIAEGDYYNGEFYFLLLVATFGMSVMAGARDLITLFVALETISIPTFVLAGFRKHDRASNEAGVKYYLIGVLSSALMLYGMSLIYGVTGATRLSGPNSISSYMSQHGTVPLVAVAMFLSLVGFAFK